MDVSLIRQAKRNFYETLIPNLIKDNRKFWKQVKPFFSDKTPKNTKIMLLEGDKIITEPAACAETFNIYFSVVVCKLDIDRSLYVISVTNSDHPVDRAIEMYKNHPSILKINQLRYPCDNFFSREISESSIAKSIEDLDSSKAYQKYNIPPKVLRASDDLSALVLCSDINRCISDGRFPNNLKSADLTPTFKKAERSSKVNYRSISILPTLSKVYERLLYPQIYGYFDDIFSKFLCGFRKGYSTQHCLLYMLETLRKALDKGYIIGVLLTDLSRAFDRISHELLIEKLYACGFSTCALNLINDYFSCRRQRTKVRERFSTWREIMFGVPQGSILGQLLFNIYLNDLFSFSEEFDMANYAEDCSPYESSASVEDVIFKLENDARLLMEWYTNNYLSPNPDKWHLLFSDR